MWPTTSRPPFLTSRLADLHGGADARSFRRSSLLRMSRNGVPFLQTDPQAPARDSRPCTVYGALNEELKSSRTLHPGAATSGVEVTATMCPEDLATLRAKIEH